MHDSLVVLHSELGVIHGDISASNIIIDGERAMLIDFELCVRIGSKGAQGTEDFFSIAIKKCFESKLLSQDTSSQGPSSQGTSMHTNKRRDDFESLFLVTIFLMSRKLFPWAPNQRDATLLSEDKFEKDCLASIVEMRVRNSDKDLKKSLEMLKLWRRQLYDGYNFAKPETAIEIEEIKVLKELLIIK